MQADKPIFSVVIPTYRRPDLLALCLAKLRRDVQTVTVPYEVIVSDDDPAGSAKSGLASEYPWVRWVQGPGKGPASNRNTGASFTRGEWLVFTDDDCLPEPGWLAGFAQAIEAIDRVQVLEGKTMALGERRALDEAAPVNETGGFLWSCNLALQREAFDELRGFDEGFRHACMEDVDFADRIQALGLNTQFVENALILHPWRKAKKPWNDGHGGEVYYPALCYYLEMHPEKKAQHGSHFYLRNAAREFLTETLPGIFRYRCRGLGFALRQFCYQMQLAWRLR